MVTYFPKQIAQKGILLYVLSLSLVSILYMNYAIPWYFMLMGFFEVTVFFVLASKYSHIFQRYSPKGFQKKVFWTAFVLRLIWVLFSYLFYESQTGQPFEYLARDSKGYHDLAAWLSEEPWSFVWNYLFLQRLGYSDSGYPLYLTSLYKLIGCGILPARFIKALLGAFTCVLMYKLTARNVNEPVARMAAVFCALMPNLYVYCGEHLKETEMLFLEVAFLERADYAFRSKKIKFWDVVLPLVLGSSLFLYRTVLGATAVMSVATWLLFSTKNATSKGRKVRFAVWAVLTIVLLGGSVIMNEVEDLLQNRTQNQQMKRTEQTLRGNQWAKYATGTVMAPMIFVLPFSTMVDTDQYNQLVVHGGNFVRNFMGVFVLIGLFSALFVKKNWRDMSLLGSFTVFYLLIISMTGFANSERFLLPGLPGLLVFAAYGISELNAKSFKFVKIWYVIVVLMQIGWAYFKLGSRGLFG